MSIPDPGLDITALRALRGRTRTPDVSQILQRIETHLDTHQGYLSLSGGKDSVTALHLARQVDPNIPVAFFDSGLEFPENIDYLSELANRWELNLHVYQAEPSALDVLVNSGAWDLSDETYRVPDLLEVMIARPSATAHAHHGPGNLWGVRSAESTGRRIAYAKALAAVDCPTHTTTQEARRWHGGTISRRDGTTTYGPIWDWTTNQVWSYLAANDIPPNPVYAKLAAAGAPAKAQRLTAMLDGVAIDSGRLVWLQRGWPDLFNTLAGVLPRIRDFT